MDQLREVNQQLVAASTQLQEQADELQRRAAEPETIFSSVAEGLVIYNSSGQILRMNPAAEKILGYSPEEREKPLSERIAMLRIETADGKSFSEEELPARRALHGETERGVVMVVHRPPLSLLRH